MNRGYGQYCPIAKGAEVLAERWTPLIIRNLHLGCHSFQDVLAGCPRMSSTLLSQRLRRLERDGVLERVPRHRGRGHLYYLTPAGQELAQVVVQLGTWGARWLDLGPRDYDAYAVLWAWSRLVDVDRLPARRVVVRFDLEDRPRDRYWLLFERPRPEVCVKYPGFEEDLVVHTDSVTLTEVHRGRLPFDQAVRSGALRIDGPGELVRALPTWGGRSYYADVRPVRTATAGRV